MQFLLTVGTIVLGLFVASRVLGIEAGSGAARPQGKKKGGRWGSGRCVLHDSSILSLRKHGFLADTSASGRLPYFQWTSLKISSDTASAEGERSLCYLYIVNATVTRL